MGASDDDISQPSVVIHEPDASTSHAETNHRKRPYLFHSSSDDSDSYDEESNGNDEPPPPLAVSNPETNAADVEADLTPPPSIGDDEQCKYNSPYPIDRSIVFMIEQKH